MWLLLQLPTSMPCSPVDSLRARSDSTGTKFNRLYEINNRGKVSLNLNLAKELNSIVKAFLLKKIEMLWRSLCVCVSNILEPTIILKWVSSLYSCFNKWNKREKGNILLVIVIISKYNVLLHQQQTESNLYSTSLIIY